MKQYTAEWAAAETEIAADKIRRITKEFIEYAKIGSTIEIEERVYRCGPLPHMSDAG